MTPKLTQIANLIKLAKADGELDHREVMLIYGIAQKNGVSKFEMDEIIERADSIETSVPADESEKIRYFYQLLVLSTVDSNVDDDEVKLLTKIGAELKLDPDKVAKALHYVVNNETTDLTDGALAGIIG
jgi:uncharacterized membrane protein YebE (DUF533 family)